MSSSTTWEFPPYTKTIHRSVYPAIDPTNPANSAAGKVIVVTGGGVGVGKAISECYVKAGAKAVAILGRRESVLEEAKKEFEGIEGSSTRILTFKADVVDEAALKTAFETVAKEVGPIDVVVANAGYMSETIVAAEADIKDWWKTYEVNVLGTLLTFRAWLPHKATKDPTFISLNALAVHSGIFATLSGYVTSKLATAQLVAYLQAENPEIRAMSYHPGILPTDMKAKASLPLSEDNMSLPAAYAVWLASPAAAWTGGRFLWAHWDVEELVQMKEEILAKNELVLALNGWPKEVEAVIVA